MLRFLACLSPMYEQDGVAPILDELFGRAVDLQTSSSEDTLGPELVKIILFTIPYLLASTEDAQVPAMQQRASEILEKTDIVASSPHVLEALVDPYPNTNEEDERPMTCASVISLLQRQLQEEANSDWKLTCIPRVFLSSKIPHKSANSNGMDANGEPDAQTNGETEPQAPAKHAFPTITVPSPVKLGPKALFPELYFSLYADQEIESVPPTSNIASCLIRDATLDTINILDYNRNVTAKLLNDIDCFWAPNTFVKRGTPFDKLRDMPEDKTSWKPEDVAVDAIFSQIFQLPAPEHRLVYYHVLITEICKISPQAIAPSLGRAIRFLFRSVDLMDMELAYRFMDWFAHHLSNFEFRWKWQEWIPDLDLANLHPKKAFIIGALDKEIRLSFSKRIRETLPQEFRPLVSESKEKDPPDFKYNNDQEPYAKEGLEVSNLIKKKAPEADVQKVLDAVQEKAIQYGVADPLVPSTDIYMTSICSIGAKSMSHVLSTIDRCKDRLLQVASQSEPARRQIISSVVDFWVDHPGNAVNIVDKLLNYSIITPMSVIEWALQDHMDRGRALASAMIYEMLATTMFKVTDRLGEILKQRNNPKMLYEQRQQIDEILPRERQTMREMFAAIEDAVSGVASGAQDEMIERFDGESVERDLIVGWGERWARVWRRKAAVVEAVVGEAAIQPLEEPPTDNAGVEAADDGVEQMDEVN